ncbi:MAG: hypothetical protein ABSG25_02865 [Bryobacteraceae bacterium]
MSYLDIGSGVLRDGPSVLVNGCWSPVLPAFIAAAFSIFRPAPSQELPLLHALNFVLFILVLLCFTFFLRMWLASLESVSEEEKRKYLVPFGFFTFLWFTMEYIGMMRVGPDLCVDGVVFLAAGIVCRLSLPGSGWKHYTALGCALALGYYTKAVMFPLGLALLCILVLMPPKGFSRKKLLVSVLVFFAVAAPLIVLMSKRVGRMSTGEVGPLMYLWYVNGIQPFEPGWPLAVPAAYGAPTHPPRTLTTEPLTLEFASPVRGTFPLFYEPTYWHEGLRTRWNLGQQLAALRETLREYIPIAYYMGGFSVAAVALCLCALRRRENREARRDWPWWQWAWPIAACVLYGLVYVEHRYIAAFLALFWCGTFGLLLFRVSARTRTTVLASLLATHLLAVSGRVAWNLVHSRPPEYEKAGQAMHDLGLREGDQLAFVGDPLEKAYAARYARMRIVAQIQDEQAFWHLSGPELERLERRLASIGVKAVVSRHYSGGVSPGNWFDVSMKNSEGFSILPISGPHAIPVP